MGETISCLGIALIILAFGVAALLIDFGEARKAEAQARLIEAENQSAALNHRKEGRDA